MCGIVGVATRSDRQLRGIPERMTATIVHRGPDGEGLFVDPGVGLGHRRLSIIDVAGGHQPMSNEDDSTVDRFQRRDLQLRAAAPPSDRKGHSFRTKSDTETILHLYEEIGADCVERSTACSHSPSGIGATGSSSWRATGWE